MSRSRTRRFLVTEARDDSVTRHPDELIVEEPMTIQLDGVTVATTMRTPGNDFELAVGFCHTEGLLAGASVNAVKYCATASALASKFNVVSVETGSRAPQPTPRLTTTSSSCGWCGSEQIDELTSRLTPLENGLDIDLDLYRRLPDLVRARQALFAATGAIHAAATFDDEGSIDLVREDVGRHNAVDKVVGALVLNHDLPAHGRGLFVSGRVSVEIVAKAWAGGFGTLVAVSAPTALAVEAARRASMTLVGFVSDERCNVYAPERLDP